MGANASGSCVLPGTNDDHGVALALPAGAPAGAVARVSFEITWTPVTGDSTTSDQILQVTAPDGAVGRADGGNPEETVTVDGLVAEASPRALAGRAAPPEPAADCSDRARRPRR